MRGRPRSQRRAFWGGVRWLTFGAAASGAILIKKRHFRVARLLRSVVQSSLTAVTKLPCYNRAATQASRATTRAVTVL